jgi:hypothetical protein
MWLHTRKMRSVTDPERLVGQEGGKDGRRAGVLLAWSAHAHTRRRYRRACRSCLRRSAPSPAIWRANTR